MATVVMEPTAIESVRNTVVSMIRQAEAMVVRDDESYEMGCAFLQIIGQRRKQVEAVFDPVIQAAHEAHKRALAAKAPFMSQLQQADTIARAKITAWRTEQDRARRDEELRLAAEARKRADEEALNRAAALLAAGDAALADAELEAAAAAPAPVVVLPSAVPKQEGIASRTVWKFRIIDEAQLPREYLMPNEKAIGAVVRAQKSLCRIPGIQVYSEEGISVQA